MQNAVARYEAACRLLPVRWQNAARQLPEHLKERAEELRLRIGQPVTVLLPEGERFVSVAVPPQTVTSQELEQLCDLVCGYSRYAVSQTLAQGYLIAKGGFRIGLCGTGVLTDGVNTNLRDISSAAIRIGREKPGIARPIFESLFERERFCSTLLISPPGGGKTTLLRDLVRTLSDGTENHPALRVSLVDERGEVAGVYRSMPQFCVGCHTDILDGCPKASAMEMLTRSMNPQVIAVDEITAQRDLSAMEAAAYCGCALLATAHGASSHDLQRKPLYGRLLKMRLFERAVVITKTEGQRAYEVVRLS